MSILNSSTVEKFAQSSVIATSLSDKDYAIVIQFLAYTMVVVSMVGVVTNSINIRTFISMGLDDGITVSLLGLAVSDLGFTVFGCMLGCSNVISSFEVRYGLKTLPVEPRLAFGMIAANIGYMFYQVTCMITTFMAVARCMCVAMPFQFKNYFTRSKSVSATVVFALIAMAMYIPMLAQMGTPYRFDPIVNKSRIVLGFSVERKNYKNILSFIHFVLFVFVSTFVVIVCVIVMAKYLRQSVSFRQGSSSAAGEDNSSSGSKLSGKELQVVRQVMLISIIFTVCMLPTILYAIFRLIDDTFKVGGRVHDIHFFTAIILELINSSTTLPIYYFYNSKFNSHSCLSKKPATVHVKQ